MGAAWPDREVRAVPGGHPSGGHKEGVIQKQVAGSYGEERGRQALQIRIERRDGRVAPVEIGAAEIVREDLDAGSVQNERLVAPIGRTWGQAYIVAAGEEVGAPEGIEAVPVAQAQQGQGREMGAGRLAADEQARGAEAAFRLTDQPEGRRLAIVGTCRERMLGGKPVLHRHHRQSAPLRQPVEPGILLVGGADGPAAAMDVEIGAPWVRSGNDPQRKRPARAIDGDDIGPAAQGHEREGSKALAPVLADQGGRGLPVVAEPRELGHDVGILGVNLLADGGGIEEGGVDHAELGLGCVHRRPLR